MNAATAQILQPVPNRLYSYVVTHDTGFAPNPFFGYCTLACCKPAIRRTAKIGDWVVGLTPQKDRNRIVYFMRVDEILPSFDSYWLDRRFAKKKPRRDRAFMLRCGDNIYEPQSAGQYRQLPSMHSYKQTEVENPKRKEHDLRGKRVLVSETFAYFGANAINLPPKLTALIVRRAHKCHFPDEVKVEFLRFVSRAGLGGIHSDPRQWPSKDGSCVTACGGRADINT